MGKHLKNLTGLRFVAAALIFGHHSSWNKSSKVVENFFSAGYVGVSFFFVLSGFVIAYSYQGRLNKEVSKREYLLLRLARIYPMHFLTALPYLCLAIFNGSLNIHDGIINLSLIQSFFPEKSIYFSLNSASWSLSNELFFYLIFLLLFKLRNKILVLFQVSLMLIVLLVAFYTHYQNTYIDSESFLLSHWLFYIFPPFRIIEFISGILLYRLYVKGATVAPRLLPVAYLSLVIAMLMSHKVPEPFRYSLFFLPFIVFVLSTHLRNKSYVDRLLSSKLMILLGEASFSFYLIHRILLRVLHRVLPQLGDFFYFLLSGFIIIFIAVLVYFFVERKIQQKLKKLILRPKY